MSSMIRLSLVPSQKTYAMFVRSIADQVNKNERPVFIRWRHPGRFPQSSFSLSLLPPHVGTIPWICYERSFSEFWVENNYFSIKGFSCLFSHCNNIYWLLPDETKYVFPTYWLKKWISEFCRTNPRELKCWSTFCVNYFLRYYLMMRHQPIAKRVNGTHEWAHRPYQLLSAPYHCCLYKHRR